MVYGSHITKNLFLRNLITLLIMGQGVVMTMIGVGNI